MSNSARIGVPGQLHEGTAWLVRRLTAVWMAAWMGMILLVVLLTVVTLNSPAAMISAPPDGYSKAVKLAGEPLMRELLRFQAAQINSEMLAAWGSLQVGLSAVVFGVLLFFSTVGKVQLGVSLALLADSLLLKYLLIPNLYQLGRHMAAAEAAQRLASVNERYQMASLSFFVSQSVPLLLGSFLLVLLLRRSYASRRGGGL
jgi:hypothetical protein